MWRLLILNSFHSAVPGLEGMFKVPRSMLNKGHQLGSCAKQALDFSFCATPSSFGTVFKPADSVTLTLVVHNLFLKAPREEDLQLYLASTIFYKCWSCIGVQSRDISITTKERSVVHPVEKYRMEGHFYWKGIGLIFLNVMYYTILATQKKRFRESWA